MNRNITLKESELIVDALLFYESCQSEFVSYDEHVEMRRNINKITNKIVKKMEKQTEQKLLVEIINKLTELKKEYPDTEIILETTNGTASCKIKDANIYEGMIGKLVIDAE